MERYYMEIGFRHLAALSLASAPTTSIASAQIAATSGEERVIPSSANPAVREFNDPNLVYAGGPEARTAPLVIFLPGTGGNSEKAPNALLDTIRQQGYRLIYLTYNDEGAAVKLCFRHGPNCTDELRGSRTFGGRTEQGDTPPAETIAQRLTDLLLYLQRVHPDQGWSYYLDAGGRPMWPRIVLSGLSQGAGMAAYMAKRVPVDRVVLFSSPWDNFGPDKRPAPWILGPSATPPERWWAERNVRENTTDLIAMDYAALRIPRDHILLFSGGLPPGKSADEGNPYHGSTIRMPEYAPQWRTMYGQATRETN